MVDLGPLTTNAQQLAERMAELMTMAHERGVEVWYMESDCNYQVYDERTGERLDVKFARIKGRVQWVVTDG